MKIQILQMIEGARKARGLTVVIDVFRAFSLECYLMAKHPSRLCPVGAEQTARDLKMRYPEAVLIGERHGVILPGFEYGNSPSQTEAGRTGREDADPHHQRRNPGNRECIRSDRDPDRRSLGECGSHRLRYIKASDAEEVSLVAMGWEGKEEAPEGSAVCQIYQKSSGRDLYGHGKGAEGCLVRRRQGRNSLSLKRRMYFQKGTTGCVPTWISLILY